MRIPTATYRLQFTPTFGFSQAKQLLAYLSALGVSDIYASPILKPNKGSTHGYDVVEPTQLNPELGTSEQFDELATQAQTHGLGWVQDIVPNHMAYSYDNQMLMDVMENGIRSQYFKFFDIDWEHPYDSIKGKLLAPFLGKIYSEALESGEIRLQYDATGLTVRYYDLKFPLKIESYLPVFTYEFQSLEQKLGQDHPELVKLLGILYFLKSLPSSNQKMVKAQYDQIRLSKSMLWELYTNNERIREFIDRNLAVFNGKPGVPASFNLLDDLLALQFFRLSFWKVATEEINYRRFFNINGLISLNIQNPQVFDETHRLVLQLIRDKKISGLRLDHIDGLYDPAAYLQRLREQAGGVYLVVEKILEQAENLPALWPVDGTTGYDFLNYVNGIFCQADNEKRMTDIYNRFTLIHSHFEPLVLGKKRLIMDKHMASDIDNLAQLMKKVFSRHRYGRDITLYGLRRALVEIMALFPIYRTYITRDRLDSTDHDYIKKTVAQAKETNPELLYHLNLVERFLLLQFDSDLSEEEQTIWLHFVMRFQQFTGPLMAKAMEDTLFYVYNRQLSLNEVGGTPGKFGILLAEFHNFNATRQRISPHSMNATSTHDTKRSEDVRARLNVISELPQEWENNIDRWCEINQEHKSLVNGVAIPDRNDEYFLYQTLLSVCPFQESDYPKFVSRMKEYIIKAVREAKVHTGWLKPDSGYENAYLAFLDKILQLSPATKFWQEFLPFQLKIAAYGIWNALSQVLLKMTAPGVPDFYQGTELWDFSLVDPDNRRPVDFDKRNAYLEAMQKTEQGNILKLIDELFANKQDGRLKLFLIYRTLKARKEKRELFEQGSYIPLKAEGRWHNHIVAFARQRENQWAIAIAPRLLATVVKPDELPLGQTIWQDTRVMLPPDAPSSWRDAIAGEAINDVQNLAAGKALQNFPVALLINQ